MHESNLHNRRSVRLPGYDYAAPGAYFITLCIEGGSCRLGGIHDGLVTLSAIGRIVHRIWLDSFRVRSGLLMDEFVFMPNHFHAIVLLTEEYQRAHSGAPLPRVPAEAEKSSILVRTPRALGAFVAGFKATSTRAVNQHLGTSQARLWQRSFYEHVIRNDHALSRIREYIRNNPAQWELDKANPNRSR